MKRWYLLVLVLLAIIAILQTKFWFGEGGMRHLHALNLDVAAQQRENERLAERNKTMAGDVRELKEGSAGVEARARDDMGLIKKGEIFYQVIEPTSKSAR